MMLTELLCPAFQRGDTPLHYAVSRSHITCVERLLSTPGIDVNIKNVSFSILRYKRYCFRNSTNAHP